MNIKGFCFTCKKKVYLESYSAKPTNNAILVIGYDNKGHKVSTFVSKKEFKGTSCN